MIRVTRASEEYGDLGRGSASLQWMAERSGATLGLSWLGITDGEIRVAEYVPARSHGLPTVIFVPGWGSTALTWRNFLPPLLEKTRCLYIETREKSTSRLMPNATQALSAVEDDILKVTASVAPPFAVLGASVGANVAINIAAKLPPGCVQVVLLAPHLQVPIPRALESAGHLPRHLATILQRAVIRVLEVRRPGRFELKQYEGLLAAAKAADLQKLSASAKAWRSARIDPDALACIAVPTLVIGSESDSFHSAQAARKIAGAIGSAELRMVADFTALHAPATCELVLASLRLSRCGSP